MGGTWLQDWRHGVATWVAGWIAGAAGWVQGLQAGSAQGCRLGGVGLHEGSVGPSPGAAKRHSGHAYASFAHLGVKAAVACEVRHAQWRCALCTHAHDDFGKGTRLEATWMPLP